MEHKRKVYLEMIRIIAIFLVIFNHVEGVTLYQTSVGLKTWGYMFISMLTSINVPLFFMVSGTLLLGKIDNFKTVIQKKSCPLPCSHIYFQFFLLFIKESGKRRL